MRELVSEGSFKRDWKKIQRSGRCSSEDLYAVTNLLVADAPLPDSRRDHALTGRWAKIGARECHVHPDVLLVYTKPGNELHLLRIASHSDLF